MLAQGSGVLQDFKEAVEWYRKAAEQGHGDAQLYLGNMYKNGYGVPEDLKAAVKWYRKSAEQGNAKGQHRMGWVYGGSGLIGEPNPI